MTFFKTLIAAIALTVVAVSSQAANLPDGVKGLKLGMSRVEAEARVKELYGQDVSDRTVCLTNDGVDVPAITCVTAKPGLKYGGVDVEGISLGYIHSRLHQVLVMAKKPADKKEHDEQALTITRALVTVLPVPTVVPDAAGWLFEDNSMLRIQLGNKKVSVVYMTKEYQDSADRMTEKRKEQEAVQTAHDVGI